MERNSPPLKPSALANFKKTDSRLSNIIGNFWKLVWGSDNPAIDQKTKYLLSLSNAVGSGRYRQATRELVKAYAAGTTVGELNELFSLFVWNQGAGHFASEIGPSQLFAAYQLIKSQEEQGISRKNVIRSLLENFGEDNPDVGTREQTI
jgi:alkylhydroperoxidase/carboxymuconolactone decarboxylase family protein YurZ